MGSVDLKRVMKKKDDEAWLEPKETFRATDKLSVEFQIKKIILRQPDGIAHGELAKKVQINRKNLTPYMKKLIKEQAVRRGPSHGKYFRGKRFFKDSILSSHLLGEAFSNELLSQPNLILRNRKQTSDYSDFSTLLPYFRKGEFGLERVIFEFVNKIGAYITYILIQALSAENKDLKDLNFLPWDRITQDWIIMSINPIVRNLLVELKDCVRFELDTLHGDEKEPYRHLLEYEWNNPQFRLEKEVIDEMSLAYSSLYPIMYHELEKLRKNLPSQIQKHYDHLQYLDMQQSYQNSCNHCYVNNLPRLIESDGNRYWTKYGPSLYHCKKCHHTMHRK